MGIQSSILSDLKPNKKTFLYIKIKIWIVVYASLSDIEILTFAVSLLLSNFFSSAERPVSIQSITLISIGTLPNLKKNTSWQKMMVLVLTVGISWNEFQTSTMPSQQPVSTVAFSYGRVANLRLHHYLHPRPECTKTCLPWIS